MTEIDHFETQRFIVRALQPADAAEIVACVNDPQMSRHLARVPFPYALEDARSWIRHAAKARRDGSEYAFLVTTPQNEIVGSVGFNRAVGSALEIGYWVRKSWWGRGVATEAGRALIDWGTTRLGAVHFVSGHFKDNPASGRVLEKLGFRPVGERMMYGLARGEQALAVRYAHSDTPAELALEGDPHHGRKAS